MKSFVPEQRSRKCFSCFEISMFYIYIYIYIYIYGRYMSISHSRIWIYFVQHIVKCKTVLFQTIQFSISTPIKCQRVLFDQNISGATTQGQSGPGGDGNKEVLFIS